MTLAEPGRSWLIRLVIAFAFAQGAVSMARPAVSYRALALGADTRAVGIIAAGYALLPLFAAVPLGRRTDGGRCAPLLPVGVVLIAGGCALSGTAGSLGALAAWSGVMGLGHLAFVIGAQSIVARQSAPAEQDRNFGHFTIGASLGQLVGPMAAGLVVSGQAGAMAGTSAAALLVSAAVAACSFSALRGIERPDAVPDRESPSAGDTPGTISQTESGGGSPPGPLGGGPPSGSWGSTPKGRPRVPVHRILRTRGVAGGIFTSLAVLSATDVLTAYLPVVGEQRGIPPATIGLLLSLRAAATIVCRLVMNPLIRVLGRTVLLVGSCVAAALLCAGIAAPLPAWALGVLLAAIGFCLGAGQPLSMTTVVQSAPEEARSTALALRLTGNRLGQVAAPAAAGLVAGLVGTAAPFAMLGLVLLASAATATGAPHIAEPRESAVAGRDRPRGRPSAERLP
ncbi:MFS transporter [Streptomyces sp. KR80]|uniref:MFS transporter n=1 Tax=Streptomyces sp. KR80 TaxID=3457426 RepID=UPI003FD3D2D2